MGSAKQFIGKTYPNYSRFHQKYSKYIQTDGIQQLRDEFSYKIDIICHNATVKQPL